MTRIIVLISSLLFVAACNQREEVAGELPTTDPSAVATAAGPPPVSTAGSPVPSSAQGAHVINVRLLDFRFEMPNQVPAGPTRFVITNDGEQKHNFEIEGQGIERELETALETGQSGELTVDLKPGSYRIYCPVGDHAEKKGMETTLTVI